VTPEQVREIADFFGQLDLTDRQEALALAVYLKLTMFLETERNALGRPSDTYPAIRAAVAALLKSFEVVDREIPDPPKEGLRR
jgi:hypothetical protein